MGAEVKSWIQTETIAGHVVLIDFEEIAAVIEEKDEDIHDHVFCTVILKSGSAIQSNMKIDEFFNVMKDMK